MQKQKKNILESLFWFCYGVFMLGLFGVFCYAFWQNGVITSWLSGVGYFALAFLITTIINILFVMFFFAFSFFARIFDEIIKFTFPSNNKAAR